MNAAGIIAEYNPFHNGHIYHIRKAREMTGAQVIVCAMAGNWTQRGTPAVCPKWQRAEAAVRNGADLVVELPYVYAVQNADRFAAGGVTVLRLARVSSLVFGSECGNLDSLQEIASLPFDPSRFHENMDAGFSYPRSYGIFESTLGPNDILAVAYCKALSGTGIRPYAVRRTVNYFSDELAEVSSASAIRKAVREGRDVSLATPMRLPARIPDWDSYYPYLRAVLLTSEPQDIARCLLVSEGIENHLIKRAKVCPDFGSFLRSTVTRRYTASRIRRTLVHILTHTTRQQRDALPPLDTLRVLAYSSTGREYMKELKKSGVSIAAKYSQVPLPYRKMEYKAAAAYSLGFPVPAQNKIIEQEVAGNYTVFTAEEEKICV